MRQSLLVLNVKDFGKGTGKVTARLGRKVYSYDWDGTAVKTGEEESHVTAIARTIRDQVQSNLPEGQTADVSPSPISWPEGFMPGAWYAYIFTIID